MIKNARPLIVTRSFSCSEWKKAAIRGAVSAETTNAAALRIRAIVFSCDRVRRSSSRIWRTELPIPDSARMLVRAVTNPAISTMPKSDGDSNRAATSTDIQVTNWVTPFGPSSPGKTAYKRYIQLAMSRRSSTIQSDASLVSGQRRRRRQPGAAMPKLPLVGRGASLVEV